MMIDGDEQRIICTAISQWCTLKKRSILMTDDLNILSSFSEAATIKPLLLRDQTSPHSPHS